MIFYSKALDHGYRNLFYSIPDCTFPFEVNIKTDAATEMTDPTVSSQGKPETLNTDRLLEIRPGNISSVFL